MAGFRPAKLESGLSAVGPLFAGSEYLLARKDRNCDTEIGQQREHDRPHGVLVGITESDSQAGT